ncbi:cytochrome C [Jannaschia sp. Os4]|uniref:c-type cytochrome n=1 Tax=Jannaschia sp. Os4 TaxID=2807617 RepID=UPI00193A0868|nr:cytochrome C [Jannaschia sp. Os4]MBM2575497.1 cytochrome C [Jannaschia sp. Os4]
MIRTTAAALALLAGPAFADAHLPASGDAEAGEAAFRQCQSCHVVESPDGEVLAGRAAKTGPNLYGVAGDVYGQVEGFRYSEIMSTAGEQGHMYTEENFVAYVQDPTGHLQEITGESGRGKMSYKVRKEEDAVNLYAFLAQFDEEEATN